jgi:acetyltransferase
MKHTLDTLFNPRSVAVIGASSNRAKLGHIVLRNIRDAGFAGKLYAINPKPGKILDVPTYTDIAAVPEAPELAVLAVPSQAVVEVARACGEAGVKTIIVIAAGFREVGEDGAAREQALRDVVAHFGMRLLGPNCLGVMDATTSLNASFAGALPPRGNVAVVSQSGAICTAILDWAKVSGVGFSRFISVGNKPDIAEAELFEYLADDPQTEVVLAYLEGIDDGAAFREAASALARRKPLILLKAGVSDEGSAAVSSHTGTLTGSDDVLQEVVRECGILRAASLEEMFDLATYFATTPLPKGNRVAIVTNAGGPGVMTTDAIAAAGLSIASFSGKTVKTLSAALPDEANVHNPVDCIGDARASRYSTALSTVLRDKGVDAVVVLLTPQAMTEIDATADVIIANSKTDKPIVASFMGGHAVRPGAQRLGMAGVPCYPDPQRAVASLAAATAVAERQKAKPVREVKHPRIPTDVRAQIEAVKVSGEHALWGAEAVALLEPYGISSPKSELVSDLEGAKRAARGKYPIVMKIDSPDILHKSDVGGVITGITNEQELSEAYERIHRSVKRLVPKARLRGVAISEEIGEGIDVLVGAKRDPVFGPVVAVGTGGIYVEVLHDVALALAPLDQTAANQLLERTAVSQVLGGVRGEEPYDTKVLLAAIVGISRTMHDIPEIRELDLNPFRVTRRGSKTLDTRILLDS